MRAAEMIPKIKKSYTLHRSIINSVVLILLMLLIGQLATGSFVNMVNILTILKLASFVAMFALCQLICMSADGSGIDLSIGYTATMSAIIGARIMSGSDQGIILAILAAIALGAGIGAVNGTLISWVKLPPLVMTLAMSIILQGVINIIAHYYKLTGEPGPSLVQLAAKSTGGVFPNLLFVMVVVVIVVVFLLTRTKAGMKIFGLGTNEQAALFSGLNTKRIRLLTYVVSGVIAALIGVLLIGYMGLPMKDMGSTYLMPSVAAAVLGGVQRGTGNYVGVVLGAVFLQILSNLLIALNWGDGAKYLAFGLILAVLLTVYINNKRNR